MEEMKKIEGNSTALNGDDGMIILTTVKLGQIWNKKIAKK
jgi:hypothetical protein